MAVSGVNGGAVPLSPNAIINGAFDIWQRGTSFSGMGFGGFTADRFSNSQDNTLAVTVNRETFSPGSAPVSGYEGTFFHRTAVPSNSGAGVYAFVSHKIEDARSFAGQTVTFSFWAKATSGTPKIGLNLGQNFGTGGSSGTRLVQTPFTISTSWARYQVTLQLPSIVGKTIGSNSTVEIEIWYTAGSTFTSRAGAIGNQSNTFDIWGVQLEAGTTATPFKRNANSIQGELAACQRYYERINWTKESAYAVFGMGVGISTTIAQIFIPMAVDKRVKPTSIDTLTAATGLELVSGNAAYALTSLAIEPNLSSNRSLGINAVVGSGLTANAPYYLRIANNVNCFIGISAEL
jgi:hypothetical protein